MPDLVCATCGTTFRPNVRAPSVTFVNCRARCPMCGKYAPIPDGTYDLSGFILKIVEAAPSIEEWTALYTALRVIDPSDSTPERVLATVEEAVPRLVFDEVLPPGLVFAFLQVLLLVIPKIIEHFAGWGVGTAASAVTTFVKPYLDDYIKKAKMLTEVAVPRKAPKTTEEKRKARNKRKAAKRRSSG